MVRLSMPVGSFIEKRGAVHATSTSWCTTFEAFLTSARYKIALCKCQPVLRLTAGQVTDVTDCTLMSNAG